MNECLVKNLCNGPRDYPMNNGESLYLGIRGKAIIDEEQISQAIRLAEHKGLLAIIPSNRKEDEG